MTGGAVERGRGDERLRSRPDKEFAWSSRGSRRTHETVADDEEEAGVEL